MLRYIKFRVELQRLKRVQKRLDGKFSDVHERTVALGQDDEGELSSLAQQTDELEHWIKFHQTRYLESVCDSLLIPLPAKTDSEFYYTFDFDDDEGDRFILTTAGVHFARGKIREERKAFREVVGFWLAMTSGIIGSIIGLISVLKK